MTTNELREKEIWNDGYSTGRTEGHDSMICFINRLYALSASFGDFEDITSIIETYLQLHESKVGEHWLFAAIERIACGEKEVDVMEDYGWIRDGLSSTHFDKTKKVK